MNKLEQIELRNKKLIIKTDWLSEGDEGPTWEAIVGSIEEDIPALLAVVRRCEEKTRRHGYCPVCEAALSSIAHLPGCELAPLLEEVPS